MAELLTTGRSAGGRRLVAGACAALLAVLIGAAAGTATAEELRLAHFMSPRHPMQGAVFEPLAKDVEAATGGALTIRIYPAGALGKGPKQQYKRAVDGVADITFGLHGYTSSQFPRTLLIEIPGLAETPEQATAMLWAAFDDYLEVEYGQTKVLGLWTNSPSVIITRRKPIRRLEDLAGLKIRVPSALAAKMVESWGGVPVPMPVPKVYNALKTGVVDGVLIGASGIKSFKLDEVGKYFTTGLPSNVTAFYLVMNRKAWEKLPADQKAALEKASGREMSLRAASAYARAGAKGLAVARAGSGNEVIALDPAEAERFRSAEAPVIERAIADLEARGIPAGDIVRAFRAGG